MQLKDYNLMLVSVKDRGVAVQPISECEINGRVYKCDSVNVNEENSYIPVNELQYGSIMNIRNQKKAYFIRIQKYFWRWYVYVWEIPYRENADYSIVEVNNFVNNTLANDSFDLLDC